jgi:hypothetical protein
VLPEEKYQAGLKPLRKLLTAALEVVFADEPQARLRRLLDNTPGLNRPTFRSTVSAMQRALGMRLEDNDKSFFVSLRNELVHRVRFLPGSRSPWEQYALLTSVVGGFLLATLQWQGECYDWRGSSDGSGPRRVKLDQSEADLPTPEVM